MDLNISYDMTFTRSAFETTEGKSVQANPPPQGNGVPHPIKGDLFEMHVNGEPMWFEVIERRFRYQSHSQLRIQLLLGLPGENDPLND
jgi:hypothetical protein